MEPNQNVSDFSDEDIYAFCRHNMGGRPLPKLYILNNDRLGIAFEQEENGSIVLRNIYDLSRKRAYLGNKGTSLWSVQFTDSLITELIQVDRTNDAECSITFTGENELSIRWDNLTVKDEKKIANVQVKVKMDPEKPFSYWDLEVVNRSAKYGVKQVVFPIISVPAINGTTDDDYLALPAGQGMVSRDPWRHDRNDWHFNMEYPSRYVMQWRAFYEQGSGGIYLADNDTEGYEKRYYAKPNQSERTIDFKVFRSVSAPGTPGRGFGMRYKSIIGVFDGDWFDACRIYRRWAIKQWWAVPLYKRKDIPEWYKKDPATFVLRTSQLGSMPDVAEKVNQFINKLGIGFPSPEQPTHLLWYSWQHYNPDQTILFTTGWTPKEAKLPSADVHAGNYMPGQPGFGKAVKELKEMGFYATPFFNTRLYDQGVTNPDPNLARQWVVKRPDGSLEIYSKKYQMWDMCRGTGWWQKHFTDDAMRAMYEYDTAGIYLDSFGGASHPCFDRSHGHDTGGGRYTLQSMLSFGRYVRKRVKAVSSDYVLTDENCAEVLFPVVDGDLVHNTLWPEVAPLKLAVYGDYMFFYGRHISRGDLATPPRFAMEIAYMLVNGFKLGRIEFEMPDVFERLFQDEYQDEREYLRKALRMKMKAVNWLSLGAMLRPPAVINVPLVTAEVRFGQKCTMPAVLGGAYRSYADGSIGVFFTNYTDRPVSAICKFDLTEYLPGCDTVTEQGIDEYLAARESCITTEDGALSSEGTGRIVSAKGRCLTLNLPPRSIKAVVYQGM